MLQTLSRPLFQGKGRNLPNWSRFLDQLYTRLNIRLGWYDLSNPKTTGINSMLTALLFNMPTERLLNMSDDTDRYFNAVDYAFDEMAQRFDVIRTKRPLTNVLYAKPIKGTPTREIYVAVKHESLITAPMDLTAEEWYDLNYHPIQILYDPSPSLMEDMKRGVIARRDQPVTSIISINLPVLVFMWISYVRSTGYEGKMNPEDFIKRYLLRGIQKECVNQWLLQVLRSISENPDPEMVDTIVKTHGNNNWIPDGVMKQGIEEIIDMVIKMITSSIDLGDFINSKLLLENVTISDHINRISNENDIPEERRYAFVEFLYQLPYVEMMLNLLMFDIGSSKSKTVFLRLEKEFNRYKRQRLETVVPDSIIKEFFINGITRIENRIALSL